MPARVKFNVDTFLDNQKIGPTHILIIVLIMLAMMIDGYDIFVVGWTLPPIAQALHVPPHALTGVFVAQQLGLLIGTLVVGPLSDRLGRRSVLLTCVACFTLITFLTTMVGTPAQMVGLRFIAALFCSAVIPLACTLAAELAPKRLRAAAVTIVFCGYSSGGFVGAFVQAYVLEPFGWQGAFWVGGFLGAAILAVLIPFLPESIRFRVQKNGHDPRIVRALRRFEPGLELNGDEEFVLDEPQPQVRRAAVPALVGEGRLGATLCLWVGFLSAFVVTHIMGSWSVTVLHNIGGLSLKYLGLMSAVHTSFGIFGMATSGFLIDRFGATRVLPLFFLGGAVAIAAYGLVDVQAPLYFLLGGISGYFTSSGLASLNALASILYPSRIRATGLSWAAGAGRIGGVLGPTFGGFMLAGHWNLRTIYLVTGLPLLISAMAMVLMGHLAAAAAAKNTVQPELAVP